MLSLRALAALITVVAVTPVTAQQTGRQGSAADSVFERARRLVTEGQAIAGRRLLDSVLAATPEGSPRYAEALWWRATLGDSAETTERDLRRLSVEYPMSPRAEEALVRLAQLELARGDRALALRHLERLALEHPGSPQLPRASYWEARVRLEEGDVTRGCAALARARVGAAAEDVELRNQVEFYARRCEGVDTSAGLAAAPPAADSGPTPARPAVATGSPAGRYTVQVAAFQRRPAAESLRVRLVRRGVEARIVGEAAPFRVRVGRYATMAE
ncbi:MAG TPA: SPOR domain-containing protein, partial [Gemmatimonadaceae bacterium]|nr:SPOR domain-containing protein [Gemmatimonadaceae bacterium]